MFVFNVLEVGGGGGGGGGEGGQNHFAPWASLLARLKQLSARDVFAKLIESPAARFIAGVHGWAPCLHGLPEQ